MCSLKPFQMKHRMQFDLFIPSVIIGTIEFNLFYKIREYIVLVTNSLRIVFLVIYLDFYSNLYMVTM